MRKGQEPSCKVTQLPAGVQEHSLSEESGRSYTFCFVLFFFFLWYQEMELESLHLPNRHCWGELTFNCLKVHVLSNNLLKSLDFTKLILHLTI